MTAPASLIGHQAALERLLTAHRHGCLGHALLLTGPAGLGKTTLALALALAALDAGSWPGGLLAHPDLWPEDSDSERVGIDRIRAGARAESGPSLQDFMSLRTYAGGMRVAILARAERLTEQAADCLLKTLEEPPPDTLIVLAASSPEALPETILSRAQQVPFAAVPGERIARWLEESGTEPRLARLAAGLSGGRPGRARRLAAEPGALAAEVAALHAFLAVAGGGMEGALRAAAELTPGGGAEGRERAMVLLAVWASFVRDAAMQANGVAERRLWADYGAVIERWAEALGPARLAEILGLLLRAGGDIAQYTQPRLTFETLFLDIFAAPQAPPPVEAPAEPAGTAAAPGVDQAAAGVRTSRPAARRPRPR